MSQKDGVSSSLASIEAASHRTVITTTTTSASHPSTSSVSSSNESSTTPQSSESSRSGTISGRVHIPKLSAATTELLARVAGNIRGTQQQVLLKNDQNPVNWRPFPFNPNWNNQHTNSQVAGRMRTSSTLIELPTAPFVYPNKVETLVDNPSPVPPSPQASNGVSLKPSCLANIAAKPGVKFTTSTPTPAGSQVPTNMQLPPESQPPPPPGPPATATTISISSNALSLAGPSTGKTIKATPVHRQRRGAVNRKRRSKKRKRGDDSDGEDIIRAGDSSSDESDITPTATQTKSGRQVNRPSLYVPPPASPAVAKESSNPLGSSDRPQETTKKRKRVFGKGKNTNNITCKYCQRGHSPPSNTIVFCDGCNRAWHQHCHDPPIGNDVISVKEKEWHCRECKPVDITITHPTVVRSNPTLTSAQPPVHAPLHLPPRQVGGSRYTMDNRRRFLSSLSHATLVELYLTLSEEHMQLPMFPVGMEELLSSKFPFTQTTVSTAIPTPTALPIPSVSTQNAIPSNPANSATRIVPEETTDNPSPDPASERTRKRHHYESSDEESEYEFQEHRLYPRAGNGVRLSTNVEDLDILQEDPTCPTFSYALHGPAQASGTQSVSA